MPRELEPGTLYVSEEFGVAGHMCPCGCGNKVITPIGPIDWSFTDVKGKPTLYPSIGNWQLPCRSHYWITEGVIEWSYQWTTKQVLAGRHKEEKRKRAYFKNIDGKGKKQSVISRILNWFFKKL